jgi:hypothetical protein
MPKRGRGRKVDHDAIMASLRTWLLSGNHIGVFGPSGYGKTLTIAFFAYWMSRQNFPIYSNMATLNPKYINYTFLEDPSEVEGCGEGFVLIDEPADWGFDSYHVRSATNRYTQDVAKHGRKRFQSIWLAEQRDMKLDPNMYYNLSYIIIPEAHEDRDIVELDVIHRLTKEWVDSFDIPLLATTKMIKTTEEIKNVYEEAEQAKKIHPVQKKKNKYERYLLR